ncbi:MAG: class I SAM-dependent methyltransferase, partial [Candidatus Heimdallarchaeaceae archaeon]
MDKAERFWDKRATGYENQKKRSEPLHNRAIEKTKIYLKTSDIVLDYGCGSGLMTNQFTKHVKRILGIDISSKMIDVARRNAEEDNIKNIDYAHSTIFDEKLAHEFFNVITAFNVLHLVEDEKKTLKRINELLKPGGLLISETVCLDEKKSFLRFVFKLVGKLGIVPNLIHYNSSEL